MDKISNKRICLYTCGIIITPLVIWQLFLTIRSLYELYAGVPIVFSIQKYPNTTRRIYPIPPVCHQMWKTNDLSTYPIAPSHETWKKMYPTWTVKLWTDKDISKLVYENYPSLWATYTSYSYQIQRADLARLIILHSEGGIYVDLDVFPNRLSLDALRKNDFVIPVSSTELSLINHFIMSERQSPILNYMLENVSKYNSYIIIPYLNVFWTGSIFLTKMIRDYISLKKDTNGLAILSSKQVKYYIKHFPGRSWHSLDGYILNKIESNRKFSGVVTLLIML
ncbi:unnamed protein product, partial [Didymodactylos carnosus]